MKAKTPGKCPEKTSDFLYEGKVSTKSACQAHQTIKK